MPANSDTTFWTDLGYTARQDFRGLKDYQHWIAQMRDVPRYFHEQTEEMRAGLKRGFTPPQVTLTGRDGSIANVVDAKPEESLYYTPFKTMPGIAPDQQAKLRAEAVDVIKNVVQPAYVELLKFWNGEYVPGARKTLAAQDMPDGKAYYRQQILEYTTLDMDPAEIHKLGEQEVASLHAQMVEVMKETGFKGDFPAFQEFPAQRSSVLRKDQAGIARQGGVDRQAVRRQGGALFRPLAARALRDQAGAGTTWRRSTRRDAAGRAPIWSTPTTCRTGRSTISPR